ncbi:MAG TPA: DUF397 domain-containing protein [Pseudonocardiaceae bacterium]|nr:DUF397 domain-containing protein [Pseudonocardiaceae bacterium]
MTASHDDLSALTWRTSSYSSGNGQCVEVAFEGERVAVRDSKHPESAVWFSRLTSGWWPGCVRECK